MIAGGGSIRLLGVSDGVVTLEAHRSPGALLPSVHQIEAVVRAAVPQISVVHLVWPPGDRDSSQGSTTPAKR